MIYRYPTPFNYLLVIVESLSQYVWVRPLKLLSAENCRRALENVLNDDLVAKEIHSKIRRVVTDQGGEFRGSFDTYLREQNIEHYFTNNSSTNKAVFAELKIRHIKAILGRALSDNRSNVIGKINAAVYSLNNGIHSATRPIGVSSSDLLLPPKKRTRSNAPLDSCKDLIDATILHYQRYQTKKNNHALVKGQRQRFKVDDRVRIALRNGGPFTKVSDQQWSSESYTVTAVVPTLPVLSYRLALTTPDRVRLPLPGSYSETRLKPDLSQ